MKRLTLVGLLVINLAMILLAQEGEFPKLTGPYLGEKPPINEPLIFAKGIVSSGVDHCSASFSPDGKEIYWEIDEKIGFTKLEQGYWTKPEILSFCKGDSYWYGNPFITPDGKYLFYVNSGMWWMPAEIIKNFRSNEYDTNN